MTTLTTVTGTVKYSTNTVPDAAKINFSLSRWDKEDVILLPGVHDAQADVNVTTGAFSIPLWANTEGDFQSTYVVSVTEYFAGDEFTGESQHTHLLGVIQVPSSGPVDLADLFFDVVIPEPTTAEILAALAAAEASASTSASIAVAAKNAAQASADLVQLYAPAYYKDPTAFFESATVWPVGTRINARTGEVWDVVTAGTGDFDHPVTGAGLSVVLSGPDWLSSAFGVTFGRGQIDAVMTLNRARLTAAIEAVNGDGGGTLAIPDIIEINGFVPLLPKVSLDMRGGGIVNPTMTVINFGYGQCLLPGNFHPDFTEDFTYYAAVTPTLPTRALTVTGEGGRFSVGDQVFIASNARGETAGFEIPHYGWLNVVEGVSGDVVTFRHPVDVANVALGVALLADETCRDGRAAFFWQDGTITGGTLECATWHWSSDSATLDCTMQGLHSVGNGAIYGNTFQRTRWLNCNFYWRSLIGEQSHNSLYTVSDGCRFIYIGADGAAGSGPSLQEAARGIVYRNFMMDFGGALATTAFIRTIDARDCLFEDGEIIGRGSGGVSGIVMGSAGFTTNINGTFRADNNIARRIRLSAPCARYALISSHEFSAENRIEDCDFSGPLSTAEAVRVDAGASTLSTQDALIMRRVRMADGILAFAGSGASSARVDAIDSPFPDGVSDVAHLTRLRGRQSSPDQFNQRRSTFRQTMHNLTWMNGETASIPMGSPVGSTSVFTIDGIVTKNGTDKDLKLQLKFYDSSDTLITTAEATLVAINSGSYRLSAQVMFSGGDLLCIGNMLRVSTGVSVPITAFTTSLNSASDVRMRIGYITGTGPGDEGSTSMSVRFLRLDVQNIYDYMVGM